MFISTAASPLKTGKVRKTKGFFTVFVLFFFICSSSLAANEPAFFDSFMKRLSEELVENATFEKGLSQKILLTNLVDLEQLHCTSKFGQLVPERLMGLLQEKGWRVIEVRRGNTLKMEIGAGDYILSQEINDLASKVHCTGILTGTYLFHGGEVIVNLKLISIPENELISSATERIRADTFISSLLKPIGYGCKQQKAFIKLKPFVLKNPDNNNN